MKLEENRISTGGKEYGGEKESWAVCSEYGGSEGAAEGCCEEGGAGSGPADRGGVDGEAGRDGREAAYVSCEDGCEGEASHHRYGDSSAEGLLQCEWEEVLPEEGVCPVVGEFAGCGEGVDERAAEGVFREVFGQCEPAGDDSLREGYGQFGEYEEDDRCEAGDGCVRGVYGLFAAAEGEGGIEDAEGIAVYCAVWAGRALPVRVEGEEKGRRSGGGEPGIRFSFLGLEREAA